MKDFWQIKSKTEDFCVECGSKNVLIYVERVVVYNKDGKIVKTKDWNSSGLFAIECLDCGVIYGSLI